MFILFSSIYLTDTLEISRNAVQFLHPPVDDITDKRVLIASLGTTRCTILQPNSPSIKSRLDAARPKNSIIHFVKMLYGKPLRKTKMKTKKRRTWYCSVFVEGDEIALAVKQIQKQNHCVED